MEGGVVAAMKPVGVHFGNRLLSAFAGLSAFVFTLFGFLMLSRVDQQLMASTLIGLLAILVVWIAAERPNSGHARAVAALIDRLLAVATGDLKSPAPAVVRSKMPALASAVDNLFEQVRFNLDSANAMAMYDPVTALPNRLHFRRDAERMLKARRPDDCTALLFIDLDGFKEVNDRLGHAQGDHVLIMVANRLRIVLKAETPSGAGPRPLLARLAGDEFTILLPALGSREDAERIAGRALAALSEPFRSEGQAIEMGASIGVALCPGHGLELTGLMKAADVAMYHAKESGRARFCVYEPRLTAISEAKTQIEAELRDGLQTGAFSFVYEPRICVRTDAMLSGHASIVWHHPNGQVWTPERFMSVAEDSSLIYEIGEWVMDAAAEVVGRWSAAGMGHCLAFSVNPRQIERRDFFSRLRTAFAAAGAPLSMLELQFAETASAPCSATATAGLAALRRDGASVAIENFGAGYSSIERLRTFPLDRIKLDSALVAEIGTSESARTIASAVVHLIHGLGCEAVGQGAEHSDQIEVLRAIGCDAIEGYAPPMNEADFLDWSSDWVETKRVARAS